MGEVMMKVVTVSENKRNVVVLVVEENRGKLAVVVEGK